MSDDKTQVQSAPSKETPVKKPAAKKSAAKKTATKATPTSESIDSGNWVRLKAMDFGAEACYGLSIRKGVLVKLGSALEFIPNAVIQDRGNGPEAVQP